MPKSEVRASGKVIVHVASDESITHAVATWFGIDENDVRTVDVGFVDNDPSKEYESRHTFRGTGDWLATSYTNNYGHAWFEASDDSE